MGFILVESSMIFFFSRIYIQRRLLQSYYRKFVKLNSNLIEENLEKLQSNYHNVINKMLSTVLISVFSTEITALGHETGHFKRK